MLTYEHKLTKKLPITATEYAVKGTNGVDNFEGWFDWVNLADNILSEVPDNGLIVEAGVYKGRFAAFVRESIIRNRPNSGIKQHLIDIFETKRWTDADGNPKSFGEFTELFFIVNRFHFVKPEGVELLNDVKFVQLPSHKALRAYEPGEIDWLYIDADHSEWGCYGDLATGVPAVKEGGVVCVHDYWHRGDIVGVTRACDLFAADNPHVEFNYHECAPLYGPNNYVFWFKVPEGAKFKVRDKADFEKAVKKFPAHDTTKPCPMFERQTTPIVTETIK